MDEKMGFGIAKGRGNCDQGEGREKGQKAKQ
jgi:hypothetical protein